MRDACGQVFVAVDEDIGGRVYLVGVLRRRHHYHIGEYVVSPHYAELPGGQTLRVDDEFLAEQHFPLPGAPTYMALGAFR